MSKPLLLWADTLPSSVSKKRNITWWTSWSPISWVVDSSSNRVPIFWIRWMFSQPNSAKVQLPKVISASTHWAAAALTYRDYRPSTISQWKNIRRYSTSLNNREHMIAASLMCRNRNNSIPTKLTTRLAIKSGCGSKWRGSIRAI